MQKPYKCDCCENFASDRSGELCMFCTRAKTYFTKTVLPKERAESYNKGRAEGLKAGRAEGMERGYAKALDLLEEFVEDRMKKDYLDDKKTVTGGAGLSPSVTGGAGLSPSVTGGAGLSPSVTMGGTAIIPPAKSALSPAKSTTSYVPPGFSATDPSKEEILNMARNYSRDSREWGYEDSSSRYRHDRFY